MKTENTNCIVLQKEGKILLVKRGNRTFHGWWCLPGGHEEEGESHHQAAQREANEEIGSVKVEKKPFLVFLHDWPADRHTQEPHQHKCHAFKAKAAGELRAGDDAAELKWVTLAKAAKMQITGYTRKVLDHLYPQEYFVVVDRNDKFIRNATRQECHTNKKLVHRSATVIVLNDRKEILLEKRSMKKDLYPGYWGLVAGHVDPGESYEEAAKREMMEEIGISAKLTQLFKRVMKVPYESEMEMIFLANHNGPFKVNKEESEEVRFFNQEELREALKSDSIKLSLGCIQVLKKFFQNKTNI